MEELHNHIAAVIVRYMKGKKIRVAEAILVLDMIRLDLIKQVTDGAYIKKPATLSTKKPSVIGEKDGVHKNTT